MTALPQFITEIDGLDIHFIHAVKNVGNGEAAELATYIVEKGKPLLPLVE
jgi:hypothetical protein